MNEKITQESIIRVVRGMHDVLPENNSHYLEIETVARKVFSTFGYQEIRTPVVESVSLFERAIGEATDIVEKEMFVFKDRGDRSLCLRPEGTAGIVRAFIEGSLGNKYPMPKFFYMGSMFRAERPQKGRYREFVQIGSEHFGDAKPSADAEVITMVYRLLRKFGVGECDILINNIGCHRCRPAYQARLVEYLEKKKNHLCEHCLSRLVRNPLRVLDCKKDAAQFEDAPITQESLCEDCRLHDQIVKERLKWMNVPYKISPHLVRGLDYYNRTVFEVYASGQTGSQDALAAGGRYDTLVEQMGGDSVPAVGFALGVERVLSLLNREVTQENKKRDGILIAVLGSEAQEKSNHMAMDLRNAGWTVHEGSYEQSLKSQMRLADRLGMRCCIIMGENEIKENNAALKDLSRQTQEKVPMDQIKDRLMSLMKEDPGR